MATSCSIASTSRMRGTLRSSTGASASSEAAITGRAPFLLPAGRTVPFSGRPPLMTKLSIALHRWAWKARPHTLPRPGPGSSAAMPATSRGGQDRGTPGRRRPCRGRHYTGGSRRGWVEAASRSHDLPGERQMPEFKLVSDLPAAGDQPKAIDQLAEGLLGGETAMTLLGVTGSGKTRTMAGVIERLGRPALVMAPNKTLAAQLTNEFKELFPHNAVEYFVSYYDYYQPEAYVPQTDTYIEKDSSVNEDVERLRHSSTMSLLSRRDVIVVASVSCIYGLGSPQEYLDRTIGLQVGQTVERDMLLRALVDTQYTRNDL